LAFGDKTIDQLKLNKEDLQKKYDQVMVTVNNGVVLLAGTAQTLSDHLRAVTLAASVPGVQRVASEVQSPDTLADAEIWREPTPQQPSATDGEGAAARDLWITSATKMRLLADSRTPSLDINVDT
jgi:osmotically-inducible protein OsmY